MEQAIYYRAAPHFKWERLLLLDAGQELVILNL